MASKLVSRPLKQIDPPVLAALRLGLFQLLFLGGVAEHAAVNESVELATPALFTLAGTEDDEGCVVEAFGRQRRVHRAASAKDGALGVANQWLSPDLDGKARNHAVGTGPGVTAEENNRARRTMVVELQRESFRGAADLPEPVLNSHTVMVVVANAQRGEMMVEGLEASEGSIIPRVIARRSIVATADRAGARSRSARHRAR